MKYRYAATRRAGFLPLNFILRTELPATTKLYASTKSRLLGRCCYRAFFFPLRLSLENIVKSVHVMLDVIIVKIVHHKLVPALD